MLTQSNAIRQGSYMSNSASWSEMVHHIEIFNKLKVCLQINIVPQKNLETQYQSLPKRTCLPSPRKQIQ